MKNIFRRLVRKLGFVLAASCIIMLLMQIVLTIFYYAVEGDQGKDHGWFDWFYFTVVTTRTIGFGDITPQTWLGKAGTIFNALLPASILFGASLVVLENFFAWLQDCYRRYRMSSLTGHHIVVADADLMESVVQELELSDQPFVCVSSTKYDDLPPRLADILDDGNYFCGDPTRDEVLKSVNIEKATAIVIASADDNVNLYVLVTARGICRDIKTIVRVNRLETESKFRSVGADILIPAATMLGRMVSHAALSPVVLDFLVKLQTGTASPSIEQVHITAEDAGELVRKAHSAAVAVYRDSSYHFDLDNRLLAKGDTVLLVKG